MGRGRETGEAPADLADLADPTGNRTILRLTAFYYYYILYIKITIKDHN